MPSTRKRIGYLPAPIIQDLITKIAINEKLSQSKIVGILVEEALIERGLFDSKKLNNFNKNNSYLKAKEKNYSTFKYNDLDELISDKGITYNKEEYKIYKTFSKNFSTDLEDENNEELFNLFKQFLLFQKRLNEK